MERESMEYDVVIVGAGPAGLSAAIRLKQIAGDDLSVCVLEKGSEVGAHILSGAVIDPVGLDTLIPDWRDKGAPVTVPVTEDRFYVLGPNGELRLPTWMMPPMMSNHGAYVVSLGNVCRWLAEQAEARVSAPLWSSEPSPLAQHAASDPQAAYLDDREYREPKQAFLRVADLIARTAGPGGLSLIDVGCASGAFGLYASRVLPLDRFVGVDVELGQADDLDPLLGPAQRAGYHHRRIGRTVFAHDAQHPLERLAPAHRHRVVQRHHEVTAGGVLHARLDDR